MKDLKKLVINILILSFIALIGYLVYLFFIKDNESDSLIIDETPMHIESIRTIAEISTVSFKDEVVMDSIEFFDSSINLSNPLDWFEASVTLPRITRWVLYLSRINPGELIPWIASAFETSPFLKAR